MTLRSQLEAFPPDARLLVFTTLGHVYVGTLADIEDDAIRLARPGAGDRRDRAGPGRRLRACAR